MGILHKILNSRSKNNGDFFIEIERILGFPPKRVGFYKTAFTHSSLQKKDELGNPLNYERLEFLGDAILGAITAAYLFEKFPESDEGYLTQMRSKIVSRKALNRLSKEFNLIKFMKSEGYNGGLGENIHGNLFEAFIGALYMDQGYKACKQFIYQKVIGCQLDIEALEERIMSYKSYLIEWCQKEKLDFNFVDCQDQGKEKVKHFAIKLCIEDKVISKARSTSKKKAEEKAAQRAYFALQNKIHS